jgi:hypothetical protein
MPAWPFSTITAPTLDTGFVAVPTTLGLITALTSTPAYVLGAMVSNPTAVDIGFTIVDGAGNLIVPLMAIPPGAPVPFNFGEFMPATGLQWQASATGLIGKLWGWV